MTRPLYTMVSAPEPQGHAGLWYDKFCDAWRVNDRHWSLQADPETRANPKLDWLKQACQAPVGDPVCLREYTFRQLALVQSLGGVARAFKLQSRFVTGLGLSHPIENGFQWHHNLGTPYLPASSIKGLVRAWAEQEGQDLELGRFRQVGSVIFLDALPVRPVSLTPEVTTPHYAGWSEQDPPGDWRSPRPIPYLAVEFDTIFLFGVCPRRPAIEVEPVMGVLSEALEWLGAGARVNLGYGRFAPDRTTDRELQRALEGQSRARQANTPEGRWRLEFEKATEEKVLDWIRLHLQKTPLEGTERAAFVKAVRQTGWLPTWRAGRTVEPRTKVGKEKLKERAALVDAEPAAEAS